MTIHYLVPWLTEKGGLQEFAKAQWESLGQTYNITLTHWHSTTRLRDDLIYRRLPTKLTSRILNHRQAQDSTRSLTAEELAEYDLVHYWIAHAAMAYPELPGVISCHGLEILTRNVRYYRRRFGEALQMAKAIHACSDYTKHYLVAHYGLQADKITVIRPGIDLATFRPDSLPRSTDKIRIGTLTRLVGRKNVSNVIRALTILRTQYGIDCEYYLAGDGPERQRVLREAQASAIDFKYLGRISDESKVERFYPSLDVFVLPALETRRDVEGFGIVFLEANASGVPVVAAHTGGIPDAVRPGVSGEFANPRDPADIAAKIYQVLTSEPHYRESARKWAEGFSAETTAASFAELYDGILRGQTKP